VWENALGVIFGLLSGISNHTGTIFQKHALNRIPDDRKKVTRQLLKNPLWLTGFFLNLILTSILNIFAHMWVGPAVLQGLNAIGLIVLAIGAAYLLKEKLHAPEIIGIIINIIGVTIFGFANLIVKNELYDFTSTGFFIRISIFTGIFTLAAIFCDIFKNKNPIIPALESGFLFLMTAPWMSVMIATIGKSFKGAATPNELILFIISCFALPGTNYFGIIRLQQAYSKKERQAINLRIVQLIPTQIGPLIYFYLIYFMPSPTYYSLALALIGTTLIIISGFLLGKREFQLRKIQ